MKKFILGILGLVLLISFTAFAFPSKSNNVQTEDELYWYVVSGTQIDHTDPINNEQPMTKTELLSQPSLLPCTVGNISDCVRGFLVPQTTDASSGETDRIKKNN